MKFWKSEMLGSVMYALLGQIKFYKLVTEKLK